MNKWVPEQPSPWRKSSKRESCYGDRVYTYIGRLAETCLAETRPAAGLQELDLESWAQPLGDFDELSRAILKWTYANVLGLETLNLNICELKLRELAITYARAPGPPA